MINERWNIYLAWLEIIGTADRARKLLKNLHLLKPPVDGEPPLCPTVILDGPVGMSHWYSRPMWREALDAWDQGIVTKRELITYCKQIVEEDAGYDKVHSTEHCAAA